MSFGNYLELEILDHVFGTGSLDYSSPTVIAVALSTMDPTEDGSGIGEPVGGAYARVATSNPDWDTAAGGSLTNATDITWAEATATWGTITHFAMYDQMSAGNFLAYSTVSVAKQVTNGDTIKFSVGDLKVSLD